MARRHRDPEGRRIGIGFVLAVAILAGGCTSGSDSGPAVASGTPATDPGAAGRQIATDRGCTACHGDRGQGGIGPAWVGLAGSAVELEDGTTVVADDQYLRRSITEPGAEETAGFTVKMPPPTLSDEEVDEIVAYIRGLRSSR